MKMSCVMLVTYNRLNLTKRMLDNFFSATTSPYRLIIVDNGSTDGTTEYLKNINHNITNCQDILLHFNEKNKGIASGRNKCLEIADQYNDPYLATVDNDVEMPMNWLQDCIDIMEKTSNFYIGVNMEDINYPLTTLNGKIIQYKNAGNLGSACMVFPQKLHHDIGFFYGYETLYATEDADWGMRSRLAGFHMGYLQQNGIHFGVGDVDTGEYREWKTACHAKNLAPFQQRCRDYMSGKIPIFSPYYE
jgi:GT2 family glycosyltransferase